MIEVSVVVPTYKRPDLLARCLEALVRQEYPAERYEVVVADDAASANTARQVDDFARGVRVSVRHIPVCGSAHGPAAARNTGWRAAKGRIIAFTDDDTVPDPGWLRAGTAAFRGEVVGVAGRIIMPLPPEPTDYERDAAHLEQGEFVTANCFYLRSALEEVGGFDERFAMPWREDSDLYFSLLERGKQLVRVPDAVVVHPVRPGEWGVSVKQQRKALYNALLFKKHPQLYRQRIQARPPWHYYQTVAATVAAGVGLLTGNRAVAAAGLGLWLLSTGHFSSRRLRGTSRRPSHLAEIAVTSAVIPYLSVFWRLRGALKYRVPFL